MVNHDAATAGHPGAAGTGRIFLAGGTGFVGGYLRQALAGRPLRLLVRDRARHAKLASDTVELAEGEVTQPASLRGVMDGCQSAINLVAIIEEQGGATFDGVIRQGTVNLVEEAKRAGVGRFLQVSALGAMHAPEYGYLEAKWQSEQAVQAAGIPWTIFRPSVIFGPGDGFITVLARLIGIAPVIPVVGAGESKFQPVSVTEVVEAYKRALDDPAAIGQTYELGGGQIYTYQEMLDLIAATLGKRKPKVHLPVSLMRQIVKISKPLPRALRPPVTDEQLKMLALDNCTDRSATADLIGRPPIKLEEGLAYIRSPKGQR